MLVDRWNDRSFKKLISLPYITCIRAFDKNASNVVGFLGTAAKRPRAWRILRSKWTCHWASPTKQLTSTVRIKRIRRWWRCTVWNLCQYRAYQASTWKSIYSHLAHCFNHFTPTVRNWYPLCKAIVTMRYTRQKFVHPYRFNLIFSKVADWSALPRCRLTLWNARMWHEFLIKGVLRTSKKKKKQRKVIFDPLALLLDAALEGEIDLVKTSASRVGHHNFHSHMVSLKLYPSLLRLACIESCLVSFLMFYFKPNWTEIRYWSSDVLKLPKLCLLISNFDSLFWCLLLLHEYLSHAQKLFVAFEHISKQWWRHHCTAQCNLCRPLWNCTLFGGGLCGCQCAGNS